MTQNCKLRDDAITIWKSGVAAVDAERLVQENVSFTDNTLSIGDCEFQIECIDRLVVVGFGKASGAMAAGLEKALEGPGLNDLTIEGQVNVPKGQLPETKHIDLVGCRPPGENLPTQEVLEATDAIIDLVSSSGPRDICLCLVSGGGSALLEKPMAPISLAELRAATTFLSGAGATIYELNAVRSAISQVKGGKLAARTGGAPVIALIISDVIGDRLDVIGSGPTVPPTQDVSAIDVLERLDPSGTEVAEAIWDVATEQRKLDGLPHSTATVTNLVIGNLQTAMRASCAKAVELGYHVSLREPSGNEGDAADVGRRVASQIALSAAPAAEWRCEIMGGESTVRLCESPGRGGRNQHLILAAMESAMQGSARSAVSYCLLSGGTDGEDGNVPVAGAWMDSHWVESWSEVQKQSLLESMRMALSRCDSHSFLSEHGMLLKVPPTATNVCDLRILLTHSE